MAIDFSRILFVYIIGAMIIFLSIFIIYKILKRGKQRLNVILCGFFICIIISRSLNMYALIFNTEFRKFLYLINTSFLFLSIVFPFLFTFIIYKEGNVKGRYIIMIILTYKMLLLALLFTDPDLILMTELTNWNPIWNGYLLGFIVVLSIISCFFPTMYFSKKINKKFKITKLKKKWKYFNIGIIGSHATIYSGIIVFSTNITIIINIWAIFSLSTLIWVYLLYYGVGKNLE